MNEVLYYILFGMTALAMSPFLTGFVNLFVKQELENKKEFKPKFDLKITIITILSILTLFYFHGVSVSFFIYAFVTLLLIICMFADIKAQIIPNEVNFVGFLAGLIYAYYNMCIDVVLGLNCIAGMLTGGIIFLLIALFAIVVYKREGMGGGDVKLMGMLGLFFGFANIIQIFVLSFLIGSIMSIALVATKINKWDEYIAFGPFIVMSSYITRCVPESVLVPHVLSLIA